MTLTYPMNEAMGAVFDEPDFVDLITLPLGGASFRAVGYKLAA